MKCDRCRFRKKCKELCEGIEKQLPKVQTGRLKGEFDVNIDFLEKIVFADFQGHFVEVKKIFSHCRAKGYE